MFNNAANPKRALLAHQYASELSQDEMFKSTNPTTGESIENWFETAEQLHDEGDADEKKCISSPLNTEILCLRGKGTGYL